MAEYRPYNLFPRFQEGADVEASTSHTGNRGRGVAARRQERHNRTISAPDSTLLMSDFSEEGDELSDVDERHASRLNAQVAQTKRHFRATLKKEVDILAMCENNRDRYLAVYHLRQLLIASPFDICDRAIVMDVLPPLVANLKPDAYHEVQFEAALALTTYAVGNLHQIQTLIRAGAVPPFINLIASPSRRVSAQAVWALGNIMGTNDEARDYCVRLGIIPAILIMLSGRLTMLQAQHASLALIKAFKNLQTQILPQSLINSLPHHLGALLNQDDTTIKQNTVWIIAYCTDGDSRLMDAVISSGLIMRMIQLLGDNNHKYYTPVLYALHKIASSSYLNLFYVMQFGPLVYLPRLLTPMYPQICLGVLKFLATVVTENMQMYSVMIFNVGLCEALAAIFEVQDYEIRKKTLKVIYHIILNGVQRYCIPFSKHRVLESFRQLLYSTEDHVVETSLKCILNLLSMYQQSNINIIQFVTECHIVRALYYLQSHESFEIYYLCFQIIDRFFRDNKFLRECERDGIPFVF